MKIVEKILITITTLVLIGVISIAGILIGTELQKGTYFYFEIEETIMIGEDIILGHIINPEPSFQSNKIDSIKPAGNIYILNDNNHIVLSSRHSIGHIVEYEDQLYLRIHFIRYRVRVA